MAKPKTNIKWEMVLLGGVLMLGMFYKAPQAQENDLRERQGTFAGGTTARKNVYKIYLNEIEVSLSVPSVVLHGKRDSVMESLQPGDSLTVKYDADDEGRLADALQVVPLYYIKKRNDVLYDVSAYNDAKSNEHALDKRLFIFLAAILILYGLTVIDIKLALVLSVLYYGAMILLHYLDKI